MLIGVKSKNEKVQRVKNATIYTVIGIDLKEC
jgi:hypothetical protein